MASQQTLGGWSTKPHLGKLFMLLGVSLLLALSKFMTIFAPVPLVISALIYGRVKTSVGAMVCLYGSFLIGPLSPHFQGVQLTYFTSMIFASLIAESFLRKFHPMKSVVVIGAILVSLSAALLSFQISQGFSPKEYLTQQLEETKLLLEEERKNLKSQGTEEEDPLGVIALLDKPKELTNFMMKELPVYFIMGIFFVLWLNFYMVLRTYHFYAPPKLLKYSELTFLNFRVPDQALFFVIGGLILAVYGEYENLEWYSFAGTSLLKCLGVFYFFQGFGVIITFFNAYRIYGVFRTLTIILVIMMASWFIAGVGLFDTWFDFRKILIKKNNKES